MNKKSKIWDFLLLVIAVVPFITSSCNKDDLNVAPGAITLTVPANATTDVALDVSLTWSTVIDPDGDAVTYDVYFGTDASPAVAASTGQTTYAPTLAANTTYYWKVVAKDPNGGTSESVVWSFTTVPIAWIDATHGKFPDTRDNKEYDVIKIGDQIWFAENLAYEIPEKNITDNILWRDNTAYDGWCYYDNDKSTNGSIYGVLYQWEAAITACPAGWHLPTDEEWTTLSDYLGGTEAGGKLKETGTTHWLTPNTGATNETGFTALPGGRRHSYGEFMDFTIIGRWWSSWGLSTVDSYARRLMSNSSDLIRYKYDKRSGFSVRCVKD